ncbi:bacillithiol biosynthesis cysteine-adding enzyme BshC [Panacibacter ginsenosidivorans]|uniref:Putative cysteine ligase BshC n=1 Tax=Panacibacter ginsenosidivorans TaxID=1813871 RepID=A0A5B8V6C7_9BACT|nr:bacillithiol biosynthesis cysteine-adding enzyme BshC [Panacibacter ginsenosidivorans]QEC66423.1 bacillithiol biosynthesis cysteine-adding enzyme BshC [Panacibacter ginsenosidivorans]
MEANCTYLAYSQTNYFSDLVIDYLNADEKLQPFYRYGVSKAGIKQSIEARRLFPQQRAVLVQELKKQYDALPKTKALGNNMELLNNENTFTITTAHQPNIFTGPLYFIYKILHTIELAATLKKQLPEYNFVPVYYMGSEDADLDEIGNIKIDGVAYGWQTDQTGAVGRMKVDNAFLQLIAQMHGQLGVLPFGNELIDTFRRVYSKGKTIQSATLELVNDLFGKYGLVVLIPDNATLKKLFIPVVEKELREGFSHKAVSATIAALEKHHKPQAGGRELNLFYLKDNKRERIEKVDNRYKIDALGLKFSEDEIIKELYDYPDRFSANVILRGAFQETVLPNIAFIGGGGELAYWLELKSVFEAVDIPYPVLLLRNSFLVIEEKWVKKINELGIKAADLFQPAFEIMNSIVAGRSSKQFALNGELKHIENLYTQIKTLAGAVDETLHDHVIALKVKALKQLRELEKKMLRAEKRKFEVEQHNLGKLQSALFPGNNLQERVENFSLFYSKYGIEFIDMLLKYSLAMEQEFGILQLNS